MAKSNPTHSHSTPKRDISTIKCYKCGQLGLLQQGAQHRQAMCAVVDRRGNLYQMGEPVPYFFDSGAECSLLKEKLADKFMGKIIL